MPLITLSVSKELTEEQIDALNDGFYKAILLVPGKKALALHIQDRQKFYFRGDLQNNSTQVNFAFAQLHIVGKFPYNVNKRLTDAILSCLTEVLGTTREYAHFAIIEHEIWGGMGEFQDMNYPTEAFHEINPGLVPK